MCGTFLHLRQNRDGKYRRLLKTPPPGSLSVSKWNQADEILLRGNRSQCHTWESIRRCMVRSIISGKRGLLLAWWLSLTLILPMKGIPCVLSTIKADLNIDINYKYLWNQLKRWRDMCCRMIPFQLSTVASLSIIDAKVSVFLVSSYLSYLIHLQSAYHFRFTLSSFPF